MTLNIESMTAQLSDLSVLVLGDHCLDRNCIGSYSGFSWEIEHLPIFRIVEVDYRPGGAANLAYNFAALGVRTSVMGVWGNRTDWHRLILEEKLNACRINTAGMVEGARTPTFEKYYLSSGVNIWRADIVSACIDHEAEENMLLVLESLLDDVDFVVVSDYDETGKGVCTAKVIKTVSSHNLASFGTSRERILKFTDFDYIIINEEELRGEDMQTQACNLLHKTGAENVITTLGGKGSFSLSVKERYKTEAPKYRFLDKKEILTKELKENIDTCGCGDTFVAVFSSCVMMGYELEESMKMANSGARAVARKLYGARPVTVTELIGEYGELY